MRQARAVYIGLGSNLGDRAGQLREALARVGALEGVEVVARSALFETAPMYLEDQPEFLNAVAKLRVAGGLERLLTSLMEIEAQLKRHRELKNGPRTVDLDILLAGTLILQTPTLSLPHPLMHERAFVLAPLVQLAPALMHPTLGLTMAQLFERCPNKERVRPAKGLTRAWLAEDVSA